MNQVDVIGFLDTAGYSTTINPIPEPDQLVIKFARIMANQKIIDVSANDISRLTNLFRDSWVYLTPEDIISYRNDGTNTTLLLKPTAIAVQPGKNIDIYNLFGIEGSVGEKVVGQQAAVELITSSKNIILPKDPVASNKITGSSLPSSAPTGATRNINAAPTGATGNVNANPIVSPSSNTVSMLSPIVMQGQLGVPLTNVEQMWKSYWNL